MPRGVALALEACDRLEYDPDAHYGLVLALPTLRAEPEFVERSLDAVGDPSGLIPVRSFFGEAPLAEVAEHLGVDGPRVRVDTACASGSDALIFAHQWLEAGAVEDVIVVASTAMLNPLGVAGFNNLGDVEPRRRPAREPTVRLGAKRVRHGRGRRGHVAEQPLAHIRAGIPERLRTVDERNAHDRGPRRHRRHAARL